MEGLVAIVAKLACLEVFEAEDLALLGIVGSKSCFRLGFIGFTGVGFTDEFIDIPT